MKESYDQTRADRNSWCDLPVDLSKSVAERLIYPDLLRFRAVCKKWQRAFSEADDLHRRSVLSLIQFQGSPYFHSSTNPERVCRSRFCDLQGGGSGFLIKSMVQEQERVRESRVDLAYTKFCCSYSGWSLLLELHYSWVITPINRSRIYVHNPFRNETLQLEPPPFEEQSNCRHASTQTETEVAGFSTSCPTSLDCVIFLLWNSGFWINVRAYVPQRFFISTYNTTCRENRHRSWTSVELPYRNPENKKWKFIKDVAYVDGNFYCAVDMEMCIGTYNVALHEWDMLMNRSLCLQYRPYDFFFFFGQDRPYHMNLVKSDEAALLLAVCYKGQGVDFYHSYRFDLSRPGDDQVDSQTRYLLEHRAIMFLFLVEKINENNI